MIHSQTYPYVWSLSIVPIKRSTTGYEGKWATKQTEQKRQTLDYKQCKWCKWCKHCANAATCNMTSPCCTFPTAAAASTGKIHTMQTPSGSPTSQGVHLMTQKYISTVLSKLEYLQISLDRQSNRPRPAGVPDANTSSSGLTRHCRPICCSAHIYKAWTLCSAGTLMPVFFSAPNTTRTWASLSSV